MPIPFSNDKIWSGVIPGAGYLFNYHGWRPSGFKIAYVATNNSTQLFGGAANFAFDNNRWTLGVTFAGGNVNYDLPIAAGVDLPLR